MWSSTVQANPVGEQVVAGAAGFERVGGALTITQGTDRAVINWNSFSIGAGEITKFVQPNSSSAVLNRVITANNPSAIYGTLQANGQVYLINPAGIFIGPGGLVDTAGFVASTHDVGDKEFMGGGDLNFTGSSGASIVNQGRIEAKQGDVFLVARQVSNEGQIMASDGTVGMISGTEVCLHSIGPNNYKVRLIDVANNAGVKKTDNGIADVVNAGVIQAANAELESTGNYLSLAIKNTGVIRATGVVPNADGTVTLTGGEGDILNSGVVAAIQKNIQGETVGGRILASAKNITTDPGSIMTASGSEKGGEIKVSASDTIYAGGKMEAKSDEGKGGKIQLTGERVGLFKAEVDASGKTAGGTVLVGGDYLGKNPEVPNAKTVVMTSDSVIRANATGNGDGGKVILWSDVYTGFYGEIFARAGLLGGDGGFVETSSYDNLQAWGAVDTYSFFGKAGLWLLDPTELYITTTSSNIDVTGTGTVLDPFRYQPPTGSLGAQSQANANTILQALDKGQNVTIQVNTATGPSDQKGDIIVARSLIVNPDAGVTTGNLTLLAGGASETYSAAGVPVTGAGVVGGSGGGSIIILEDCAITVVGDLKMIAGNDPGLSQTIAGVTTVTGGTGGNITVSAPITSLNGAITLQAGWGVAADGGATGGNVSVNQSVTTSGAAGRVVITGGSANSADSIGGNVTINAAINLGTSLTADSIYGFAGSVIVAGNSTGGAGGDLSINAPINGAAATLTLQSGIGIGDSPGTFAISAGAPIGQQNSTATRLASVAIRSQTSVELQSDVFAVKIVLAPTPIPTATGFSNTGSIWLNETPISGLNSYSLDNAAISKLFANLDSNDAIEIGETTFNGDVAIGEAGEVVFSASNLTFRGSPAAPSLNRAISFNASSGTCLTLTSPFSTGKITFDTGGRLFTRYGTADVDIKFTGGTVDFTRVTGLGQSANDPLRLDIGTIQGTVTGDAFLYNSTSLNFGGLNLGANALNVVTGGAITQSGAITATGAANVFNASGSDVTLANSANNFGSVTFTSVQNATIADANAIAFGASTLTRGLTVNAGGNVTQTGALVVPGTTTVTATAGNINLANNGANNNFTGAVTLVAQQANATVAVTDVSALELGGITMNGNGTLGITVGGNLTQSGVITSGTGQVNITSTVAESSVDLSTQANDFQNAAVTFNGGAAEADILDFKFRNIDAAAGNPAFNLLSSLRNLTLLFDAAAIVLPATTLQTSGGVAGSLVMTGAGAGISQTGALLVPGTTTVTATAGNINLANNGANNNFTGAVTLVAQQANATVAVTDVSALELGGITMNGNGTLGITVGGNLTQSGVITSGTGQVNITSTVAESSVDLSTQANDFQNAAVTFNGGAAEADILDFKFRNIDAAAGNPAFNLLSSLRNLTLLFDAAAISMPATTLQVSGGIAGSLVLTGTTIAQTGALVVPGTTTVTATSGNINLANNGANNNFTGAVTMTTSGNGNISILDLNTLLLGQVTMGEAGSGTLDVETSAGDITQSGNTTVSTGTGNVTFEAAAGAADITLANQNDFRGTVSMTGGITQITDLSSLTLGTLSTGALTATSTGTLNLGTGTVTGALSATSNGGAISQTGGLTLGSSSIFNSGSGSVTLTAGLGGAAQNSFGGAVSLTSGNADFYMASGATGVGRLAQTAGSTVVTGTFTLRSPAGTDFNLANGLGGFELTSAQLSRMSVGTLAARASGSGNLLVGTFNPAGVTGLNLITAGTGNITADSITVGSLSLTSGGTLAFTQPNQVRNLGTLVVGSGGVTFQNQNGLNLTGSASMPGRLSLEVAGQFNNQTGVESPLANVAGGSVIKSLSLMGGLPDSVSGLSGFSYRYDGVTPASGNVMSYAVSPLALFAPSGTTIAGVDLSGTQTGGGQFNTFLTGSDDLNWIISDFGKFNLPKVSSAGLEYTIYPQRVEPETRTLPDSTLSQLRRELGRPPTIEEINKREVSMRQSDRLRSGSILERSSLDTGEDNDEPQENAKTTVPLPTEGQVPQANQVPKKATPPDNGSLETLPPVATWGRLPSGSVQRDQKGAETVRELLMKERASAEVDLSIPVANTQ